MSPGQFEREGAAALAIAAVIPALWKPLFLVSVGLVTVGFIIGIISLARGRVTSGILLVAFSPVAGLLALGALAYGGARPGSLPRRSSHEYVTSNTAYSTAEPQPTDARSPSRVAGVASPPVMHQSLAGRTVTLTGSFQVPIAYGTVTVPSGTSVEVIEDSGNTLKVRAFHVHEFNVPRQQVRNEGD